MVPRSSAESTPRAGREEQGVSCCERPGFDYRFEVTFFCNFALADAELAVPDAR